jgi:hypothetical protein
MIRQNVNRLSWERMRGVRADMLTPGEALQVSDEAGSTAVPSHMVFTRLIGWVASPLPLAGVETSEARSEADALEERGGWGLSPHRESRCGSTPTPTLPRKRERERSADVAAREASYAIALGSTEV